MARIKLTGFSIPWFGLSWTVTDGDREAARRVINVLEDRRVLYGERSMEDQLHCWRSAQTIREYLTTEINATRSGSGVHETLKRMRAAARAFVDSAGTDLEAWSVRGRLTDPFSVALGVFQSTMGQHVAVLAEQYNVTVDRELATILPPKPKAGD
jgi:hypothetical protein